MHGPAKDGHSRDVFYHTRSIANNNSIFFKALYRQRLHGVNRGDRG